LDTLILEKYLIDREAKKSEAKKPKDDMYDLLNVVGFGRMDSGG